MLPERGPKCWETAGSFGSLSVFTVGWVSVVRPGENAALWPFWLIPFGIDEEFGGREIHHFDGRSQDFMASGALSPTSARQSVAPLQPTVCFHLLKMTVMLLMLIEIVW